MLVEFEVDSSVRNNRPTQVETTTTQVETTHHPVRNPPPTELETGPPQSETWATESETSQKPDTTQMQAEGPLRHQGVQCFKNVIMGLDLQMAAAGDGATR